MMDWTDRHCRYFHRLLSRNTLLYTEMVTTGALLFGDAHRHLQFDEAEHPIALQLGGSDPEALARCAQIAEEYGYDEVNLNCGCPSDRVRNGAFGACLMLSPELVAECVTAMQEATRLPVTVKCRIGVDEQDEFQALEDFTQALINSGCRSLTVHARKAWLKGLSPKENRDIPPLNYPRVYQLKQDYPELELVINGGVSDLGQVQSHLHILDGAMMGRAAYQNPWLLAEVDSLLFAAEQRWQHPIEVIDAMLPYIDQQLHQGVRLASVTRHMLGLFQGVPGARKYKRTLSERTHKPGAGTEVLLAATEHFRNSVKTANRTPYNAAITDSGQSMLAG